MLFADEAGVPDDALFAETAYGFYWTEGLKGVGWAKDAVPTLKGGSTVGIPSPPAVWVPGAQPGGQTVTPEIEDAEALQGFNRGWTLPAQPDGLRNGPRWKLVGNAVTVDVSEWLGRRLAQPGEPILDGRPLSKTQWPTDCGLGRKRKGLGLPAFDVGRTSAIRPSARRPRSRSGRATKPPSNRGLHLQGRAQHLTVRSRLPARAQRPPSSADRGTRRGFVDSYSCQPVGAENHVTVSDQRLRSGPTSTSPRRARPG